MTDTFFLSPVVICVSRENIIDVPAGLHLCAVESDTQLVGKRTERLVWHKRIRFTVCHPPLKVCFCAQLHIQISTHPWIREQSIINKQKKQLLANPSFDARNGTRNLWNFYCLSNTAYCVHCVMKREFPTNSVPRSFFFLSPTVEEWLWTSVILVESFLYVMFA